MLWHEHKMLLVRRCHPYFALLLMSMLVLVAPVSWAGTAQFTIEPGTKMLPIDGGVELLVEEPGENLTRERVMQADMAPR